MCVIYMRPAPGSYRHEATARVIPGQNPKLYRGAGLIGQSPRRGQAKPETVAFVRILPVCAQMVNLIFSAKSGSTDLILRKCLRREGWSTSRSLYHVSTKGRFLSDRGLAGGSERNPAITQERVCAGSMTSSISNSVAVLSALPRS